MLCHLLLLLLGTVVLEGEDERVLWRVKCVRFHSVNQDLFEVQLRSERPAVVDDRLVARAVPAVWTNRALQYFEFSCSRREETQLPALFGQDYGMSSHEFNPVFLSCFPSTVSPAAVRTKSFHALFRPFHGISHTLIDWWMNDLGSSISLPSKGREEMAAKELEGNWTGRNRFQERGTYVRRM